MASYSIKDLENFTGIKAHTIRIWEKRHNLVEPKRTCTNIRYYDDDDLKKLLNISILNRNGYKISNIVDLSENEINDKILGLTNAKPDKKSHVESLVVSMIDLDEHKFEKVFNSAVINLGFEEAVIQLMYPFLEKIGTLWQVGTINPAQEHFISNLIRKKMIVAIDGIVENFTEDSKTFVLFLPEAEMHELGLLFYYYLIKKQGHKVIYLGETVPFNALTEIKKIKRIDFLLTSIVTSVTGEELFEYISKVSEAFRESPVYITGYQQSLLTNNNIPPNIIPIKNVKEFKQNHL